MEEQEEEINSPIAETLSKSIGLQGIDISLDHAQKVYCCGQRITGNVCLDLTEPVSALGIRLKCKGEAQVYFTDRSAGIRRKFSASENYLHEETYVVGDGSTKCTIIGGVYPFSLNLPENLPCSFEGRYGRVRYSVRAFLDITSAHHFSTNIVPFTLASTIDLNQDSLAPLPINEQQSKVFMGQTEPLNMSMSVPVRGFVPGQTIPIKIISKNASTVVVKKLRVIFKKVVTYHASEKSRKHKEVVVEIDQPIDRDCNTYDVIFDVPAVPPTGMKHCNIIDVVYTLKVEACVDVSEWYYRMFQKNLKLRTNIIIGTIPLKNYENPQMDLPSLSTSISNFEIPDAATATVTSTTSVTVKSVKGDETKPRLSQPTYEKSCIYRSSKPDKDDPTGDEGDSDGEVKPYSPMYRVYKFHGRRKKEPVN